MSAERCPVCDREACPLPEARRTLEANSISHTRRMTEATLAAQSGHLDAQRDCHAHAHDWRAEALALRAEVAEMSARSREADAARVALGAANGETLLRAAQRVAGDAKMGAIAPLAEARLTVGAALAMPEVQNGSHVVEWPSVVEGAWWQIRSKDPRGRVAARGHSWGLWAPIDLGVWIMAIPCRLVPLSLADLDPATRGEMP